MKMIEDLADEMAMEVLRLQEDDSDNTLLNELSETIGASSQTMQEAFLTAVRVRRAERRARALIASKKKEKGIDDAPKAIPMPPPES
ncbi:MAG: hypothetical protein AAGF74_08910 [Pseudomonadota bacterium]